MKILWTFDPFQENKTLVHVGKNFIKSLFATDDVNAVYVASYAENELNHAYDVPKEERYSEFPKSLMAKELKRLGLPKVNPIVLPKETISLSNIIKEVVNYSSSAKADLLLVASNSKETLPRLIFGSFAEGLIHQSNTDLLVFHQKTQFQGQAPKKIVYAHDLSTKSKKGLERLVTYAQKWKSEIVVVHAIASFSPEDQGAHKKNIEKQLKKLSSFFEEKNLKYDIRIIDEFEFIEDIILKTAKKTKADMIAVSAHSSKLEILLGGSTTRKILRTSKLPTLVLKS